jgi:hypothetical protein
MIPPLEKVGNAIKSLISSKISYFCLNVSSPPLNPEWAALKNDITIFFRKKISPQGNLLMPLEPSNYVFLKPDLLISCPRELKVWWRVYLPKEGNNYVINTLVQMSSQGEICPWKQL